MKILHVANWCAGITTRNVNALKQWSKHQHELVARIAHPYGERIAYEAPTYTEATTSRETVLAMAHEADALHFHAVGYDGTAELPETIHGINWKEFRGKKRFILTGHCSMLAADGRAWTLPCGGKFRVKNLHHYDALFGPHLSCRETYEARLEYAPDIIPIYDWLYRPLEKFPAPRACSFKGGDKQTECLQAGIDFDVFPTPTPMPDQLARRRKNYRVTLDNFTDGHWGLFGMESLAQGVPSATFIHSLNEECFALIKATPPPFVRCAFGGADLAEKFLQILAMPESEWRELSILCRWWMERYYDPERLVWRWDELYDRLA